MQNSQNGIPSRAFGYSLEASPGGKKKNNEKLEDILRKTTRDNEELKQQLQRMFTINNA